VGQDKKPWRIYAAQFALQSDWWARMLGRTWDREPMPSCREWDLPDGMVLQVLHDPAYRGQAGPALSMPNLPAEIARMRKAGIEVPALHERRDRLMTFRLVLLKDPEGNNVCLLELSLHRLALYREAVAQAALRAFSSFLSTMLRFRRLR
jgi:hypothetical protein